MEKKKKRTLNILETFTQYRLGDKKLILDLAKIDIRK